jgi:hypothetical protein
MLIGWIDHHALDHLRRKQAPAAEYQIGKGYGALDMDWLHAGPF